MFKRLLYLLLFFFLDRPDFFAHNYPDAGSWNTFNVEYKISKNTFGIFTQECRIKENFSRLNLFYSNLGIGYKVSKNFKAAFVYRFINKYMDDGSFSFRHRLMLDLTIKHKLGDFEIAYRQRLQAENRNIYSSETGKLPEWYSRNKFELKYNLNHTFQPYVGIELRYQLHNPRQIDSDDTWHRIRYFMGADFQINEKSSAGMYYLFQTEYNLANPQDLYIVGLEYNLKLGK